MTIYFIHIPKSGGSSLRSALVDAYGEDLCLCYFNPLRHRLRRRIKFQSRRFRVRLFGPRCDYRSYRLVYGHFCLSDIVPRKEAHDRFCAVFRNPVDWVGSYLHYTWEQRPGAIPENPLAEIDTLGLAFGFRRYLGRYSIDDLDVVGITEDFDGSVELLNRTLDMPIAPGRENPTSTRPSSYADYFREKGILEEVEMRMEDNQRIYDEAVRKYQALRSSS